VNFIPSQYNDKTTLILDVSAPMSKEFKLTSK
jgi:hypothetical protein